MTLTYKEYLAMPRSFQDQWERMIEVIERMRKFGDSLPSASRAVGIHQNAVLWLGGTALKGLPTGRYVAKPTDMLLRVAEIPSLRGHRDVAFRDSRQESVLTEYWNAVECFYSFDSEAELRNLRQKWLIAEDGKPIQLVTDVRFWRRRRFLSTKLAFTKRWSNKVGR